MNRLVSQQSIAVYSAPGLGDGLIALALAENLRRAGHDTTFFNTKLKQMRADECFPGVRFVPFVSPQKLAQALRGFDAVLAADYSAPALEVGLGRQVFANTTVLWRTRLAPDRTLVDSMLAYGAERFALADARKSDCFVVPDAWVRARFPARVVIHPTCGVKDRTWAPHKFVSLARRISRLGFAPEFIVGPHERAHWQGIVRGGVPVRAFRRLKSASQYLFESGAMIGNDSSIGHLASMLAVPTLAIFCAGGRYLNMSRPGYTLGDVVVAPPPPSPRPRGWSWQRALTIDAVFAAFVDLSRRLPGRSPA